jgi:hypothetical protein
MKNQALALFTLLASMLASGSAFAQSDTFRAEVPFAFVIGNQELPAGTYQFERLLGKPPANDEMGMVAVRNQERATSIKWFVTSLSNQAAVPTSCKLLFDRRSGKRTLDQIAIAGDARAQVLPGNPQAAQLSAENRLSDEISMARLR